jgi:serine/threonine protein kinase
MWTGQRLHAEIVGLRERLAAPGRNRYSTARSRGRSYHPRATLFANDFEVIRPLSTGGMGSVYVVLQKSRGKKRALKLMLPQLVADASLRRRFEQEARVGALIESDHVIEVVAAGGEQEILGSTTTTATGVATYAIRRTGRED